MLTTNAWYMGGGKFLEVNPKNTFKIGNKVFILDNNDKCLYEAPKKEYEDCSYVSTENYDDWLKENLVDAGYLVGYIGHGIINPLNNMTFKSCKDHTNMISYYKWNLFINGNGTDDTSDDFIDYSPNLEIFNITNENKYISYLLISLDNDKILMPDGSKNNNIYAMTESFTQYVTYLDTGDKKQTVYLLTQEQLAGVDEFGRMCFIGKFMMEPRTKLSFLWNNKTTDYDHNYIVDDHTSLLVKVWVDGRLQLSNNSWPFNMVNGPKPSSLADMNTWTFPIYRKEDKERLKLWHCKYDGSIEPAWTRWNDEILTI